MKLDTHLILVSAQAVPNITPLLDEQLCPKRVVLVVSPDMQQRAEWLESVIKTKGIQTRRHMIANAFDIEHIRDRMFDLLDQSDSEAMALNATGGTKPMSIAAYEVFRAFEKPIFYVHPDEDRLIWMYPEDQASHTLANRVKLPDFLASYGAQITHQGDKHGVPVRLRELTQRLIVEAQGLSAPLSILNAYAAQARTRATVLVDNAHLGYAEFINLCGIFEQEGLLNLEGNRLRFPNEAARFYVNGGWLEDHVYGLCLNIKKIHNIQDIARSLEVERNHMKPPIRNELDVVFLKHNRLYLIECKTHSDKSMRDGKNTETLYKLDSLRDLIGGLQARAMLVYFNTLNDYDRQRARDLGIMVCDSRNLTQLPEELLKWIN